MIEFFIIAIYIKLVNSTMQMREPPTFGVYHQQAGVARTSPARSLANLSVKYCSNCAACNIVVRYSINF
jgi:hypothetical protein